MNAFVKTRWNTVCEMFATFIIAYDEIRALLNGREDLITRYNKINIDIVKEIKEFLDLFKQISNELQSDTVVTTVKILPAYEMIIEHIKIKPSDSITIQTMKKRASDYIDANKDEVLPCNYELWAFFNPDFKRLQQFKTIDKIKVMDQIELAIDIMNEGAIGNATEELSNRSVSESEKCASSSIFNKLHDTDEPANNLSNEIERYVNSNHGTVNNLLEWWSMHKNVYPQLYKFFMQFAAIPATSASAERIFSSAGNIISHQRTRLNPQNVGQLLFLHKNSKK